MADIMVGYCAGCTRSGVDVVCVEGQPSFWCQDCLFQRATAGDLDPLTDPLACDSCGDPLGRGSLCAGCSECSDCGSTATYCEEHSNNSNNECTYCGDVAEYCSSHSNRYCAECGNSSATHVECDNCYAVNTTCEECDGDNGQAVVCRACFDNPERVAQYPGVVMSDDGLISIGEMEVRWS